MTPRKGFAMTDTQSTLTLARAALQDTTGMSDGDILRACATLIEHGTADERASARDLTALIESEQRHLIEDDGMTTVYPVVHGMAEGVP